MRSLLSLIAFATLASAPGIARADEDKQRACLTDSENAQRLRNAGKPAAAREGFLRCAQSECPAVVRADCESSLAEVDAAIATIIVIARDAQDRDLRDVRVLVDNVLVTSRLDGRAIPLDPGLHTFRYETNGAPTVEEQLLTHEGEKRRLVEVRFATKPPVVTGDPTSSGPPTLGFVFAGISAVTLGVGGYFGVSALSDYGSMKDRCGGTKSCSDSEAVNVRTQAIVADVSLGIAVISAGIATWLFLTSPSSSTARP